MGNVVTENNNNKTAITYQQVHDCLSHMSVSTTRETAQLGSRIKKTQTFPCTACAAGKAKQKNIKEAETTKQKLGQ